MKAYTDLEQSKKLAEILPLESADMVSPFRYTKNDEYIPGYVVSRNYIEVYNEMMKLPGMEKKDVCQLIQPTWSLAALLSVLPEGDSFVLTKSFNGKDYYCKLDGKPIEVMADNPVDACVRMIIELYKLNLL